MAYFNNNPSFVKLKNKMASTSDDSQLPVAPTPEVITVSSGPYAPCTHMHIPIIRHMYPGLKINLKNTTCLLSLVYSNRGSGV